MRILLDHPSSPANAAMCGGPAGTANVDAGGLLSRLRMYKRELAFSEAELREARALDAEAAEGQRREAIALRGQVRELAGRVKEAYIKGSEEADASHRALHDASEELEEMSAEVLMAEGESQLASAARSGTFRTEWSEAQALAAKAREADAACSRLSGNVSVLEAEVSALRQQARRGAQACQRLQEEARAWEQAHDAQGQRVREHNSRAKELHQELQLVLQSLRASHAEEHRERRRLEERVKALERDVAVRAAQGISADIHAPPAAEAPCHPQLSGTTPGQQPCAADGNALHRPGPPSPRLPPRVPSLVDEGLATRHLQRPPPLRPAPMATTSSYVAPSRFGSAWMRQGSRDRDPSPSSAASSLVTSGRAGSPARFGASLDGLQESNSPRFPGGRLPK